MNQLCIFAPNNAVSRFLNPPKQIDYNGCIENITPYNYSFKRNSFEIDVDKPINKTQFSKEGIITRQ
jgi:hypothetical protein